MEVKGNFGKLVFSDCLEGMKDIPDKEYDLALIDPPWGVNLDGKRKRGVGHNAKVERHDERVNYDDNFDHEFNLKWFEELKRISQTQIICMSRKKEYYWIRNFDPIGTLIINITNPYGSSKISQWGAYSPYFIHGKFEKENKFERNVMKLTMICGFLNNHIKHKFIHPSPKNTELWNQIIKEFFKNNYKNKKVIDIFAGTCTIGEVCEYLGIQWLAFEIKPEYKPDIEYRISEGIKKRRYILNFNHQKITREISLDSFIKS